MKDILRMLGVVLCSLIIISSLAYGLTSYDCSKYQTATNRTTKMTGIVCYVQYGSAWYTAKEYRSIITASNLK